MDKLADNRKVTVCASCLRACCWRGEFMCEDAYTTGTVEKTVGELRAGKYGEHERYWKEE